MSSLERQRFVDPQVSAGQGCEQWPTAARQKGFRPACGIEQAHYLPGSTHPRHAVQRLYGLDHLATGHESAGYLTISGTLFGLQPITGAMSCAIVSSIEAL